MTRHVDVVVVGLGGLGSAACWQLARQGASVIGIEQFALGHHRGASHDTSRILRRSYHTPHYVRLADEAYTAWRDLEAASDRQLVTVTGGIDLFPPGAVIAPDSYRTSMAAAGVPFETLDSDDISRRWPRVRPPAGTVGLHQADTGIVPAGETTALLQHLAAAAGAELADRTPVTGVRRARRGLAVELGDGDVITADRVVVCADGWTNRVLAPLGVALPITTLLQHVTYYDVDEPSAFSPPAFPVWIWMDDPCFYGFPAYGGTAIKAGEDCGGPPVDPDRRPDDADPAAVRRLDRFVSRAFDGVGAPQRTVTCSYTLTPDRDFVLGTVPGHDDVVVALGAAHAFKFVPWFGRVLAELALDGGTASDIAPFAVDRPALTGAGGASSWLV